MNIAEYKKLARKKKRQTPEDDGQIEIIKDLREYEKLGLLTFAHIPNQLVANNKDEALNEYMRKRMGKMGVKSGISDLLIFLNGGQTIFVELKAGKRPQTTTQKTWESSVSALGFKYYLVRMADKMDGRRQIKEILQENGI